MSAGGNPIKFPMDITAALSATGSSGSANAASAPAASGSASSSAATTSASTTAAPTTNGARGTVVSTALLGVAVVAASFLAL